MPTVIFLLAVLLISAVVSLTGEHEAKLAGDETIRSLEKEMKEVKDVGAKALESERQLRKQVEALTTPDHKEALRLMADWATICRKIPMGKIMGDVGCMNALSTDPFPGEKARLIVFRSTSVAAREGARSFMFHHCPLVEGEMPQACYEFVAQIR